MRFATVALAISAAALAWRHRRGTESESLEDVAARESAEIVTAVDQPAVCDPRDGSAAESAEWIDADADATCNLWRWR